MNVSETKASMLTITLFDWHFPTVSTSFLPVTLPSVLPHGTGGGGHEGPGLRCNSPAGRLHGAFSSAGHCH